MSRPPRWNVLLVPSLLAAIVLTGVGSVAAAKVTNVKSTVIIKSGEGTEFTGTVKAAQKKCRAGRRVKLFMEPSSGGEDELVGATRTNSAGEWDIRGSFTAGMYHAQVTSSYVHTGSETLHCLVGVGLSAQF